jgi:hypothetical protein
MRAHLAVMVNAKFPITSTYGFEMVHALRMRNDCNSQPRRIVNAKFTENQTIPFLLKLRAAEIRKV